MSYVGFYINLDRSADRKLEIEAQFVRYGLQGLYERFPAANGDPLGFPNPHLTGGEIGCFTSHYLLLKGNINSTSPLHVVEDDAVFSRFTNDLINQIISSDIINGYDIIFTDTMVPWEILHIQNLKYIYDKSVDRDGAGKITTCRCTITRHIAGTSSYIVNPRSIPKLVDIYTQALKSGTKDSVDIVIRQKAREGMIRTGCLFPFVTSIHLNGITDNTIVRPKRDPLSDLATGLLRQSFFVGSDLSELCRHAEAVLPPQQNDPHHQLLRRVLEFWITDNFHPF